MTQGPSVAPTARSWPWAAWIRTQGGRLCRELPEPTLEDLAVVGKGWTTSACARTGTGARTASDTSEIHSVCPTAASTGVVETARGTPR